MMNCLHCGGALKQDLVSYTVNRHNYHLILDDVPAWVCEQCGEPLFDEKTVASIQNMLQEIDRRVNELPSSLAVEEI
jgi:YgiT-type zinc finger domain-containing protein